MRADKLHRLANPNLKFNCQILMNLICALFIFLCFIHYLFTRCMDSMMSAYANMVQLMFGDTALISLIIWGLPVLSLLWMMNLWDSCSYFSKDHKLNYFVKFTSSLIRVVVILRIDFLIINDNDHVYFSDPSCWSLIIINNHKKF